VALIRCPECSETVSDKAASCPHCGAPIRSDVGDRSNSPQSPARNPSQGSGKRILGGVILGSVVLGLWLWRTPTDPGTSPRGSSEPAPSVAPASQVRTEPLPPAPTPAALEPAMPAYPRDERAFVKLVTDAQAEGKSVENDMQLGGVRTKREDEICRLWSSPPTVKNWFGTIAAVDSNSDGKGVVAVTLAQDFTVKTWNNDLSDMTEHTLIDPHSALFAAAEALKVGETVRFSGTFFPGDRDDNECLKEGSMTLRGKVAEPEYIFRFTSLSPVPTRPEN
jgi:RNA polymerase subunit RPABC4/transcription elongation factor Spt4